MRLCFFLLLLALPAWAAESPERTMAAAQRAIDQSNPALLETYMDVRGIIASGVDVFLADFAAHPPEGEGDPLLEMLSGGLHDQSGTPAGQQMKQLLVEETRKFVIRGVASGDFCGHPSGAKNLPDGGLLAVLFADASTARKELRQVKVGAVKNDTATASARLYDYGSERSYPLRLTLKRQPQGYWKIVTVDNLAELVRMVRQESRAH